MQELARQAETYLAGYGGTSARRGLALGQGRRAERLQSLVSLDQHFIDLHTGIWAAEGAQYEIAHQVLESQAKRFWWGVAVIAILLLACAMHGLSSLRSVNLAGHAYQHLGEQLQTAVDLAVESSRSKSQLLADMSHEIRTPLNGVLGMADLLIDTDLDPRQRQFATTIASSGTSLMLLLNDLLDLSKFKAGKLVLDSAPFNLSDVIEDTLALRAEQAHRRGLEVINSFDPDLPLDFVGDARRIQQVLGNLVANAIKFAEQGQIVVRLEQIELDAEAASIRISVNDTGIGIPEDRQQSVFDAFVQVGDSAGRSFGGTGLGLAISHHIVQLMGGRISVDSDGCSGSRFDIEVRLRRVAAVQPGSAMGLPGLRALVVDDNAINLTVLESWLRAWGAAATTAGSRAEAISIAIRSSSTGASFDLILMDQQLVGDSGVDLIAALRAFSATASAPAALLSSCTLGVTAEQRLSLGIGAVVYKPLRRQELKSVVTRLSGKIGIGAPVLLPAPRARFSGRALVAEDGEVNQVLILAMLEAAGLDLVLATNGMDAIDMYLANAQGGTHFDVMLLDVRMPVLDGLDVARRVRALEQANHWPRTPLVAFTANAGNSDRLDALAAGMDDFLSKPLLQDDLARVLGRWIKPRRPIAHSM